jgi:type III secretion protein Q
MPSVSLTAAVPVRQRLPKIDESSARISRWLHDRRFARAWGTGLCIAPIGGAPLGHVHFLRLRGDGGTVELLVAADSDATLDFASGDVETADDPLMAIAALAWCDPGFEGARALGVGNLRPMSLFRFEESGDRIPRDGWSEVRNDTRALFSFRIAHLSAQVELAITARVATLGGDGLFRQSLELRGAVALAQRNVARELLASLMPGDVLLLDLSDGSIPAGACRLRWGSARGCHWSAAVQVDDTQITLDGDIRMNDLPETGFSDAGPPSLDALELPVRFEVDTVGITLGQIESMAPGQVIALAAPLAGSQLRLVACGQVVGSAELVVVGDRLGARILHMADTHAIKRG